MSAQMIHGNMLVIKDCGVLIRGRENMGKSELALALIDRGHKLVCDDCVEILLEKNKLIGQCPKINNQFIHINGIGVIYVTELFGENSFIERYPLQLAITLVKPAEMPVSENSLTPCYEKLVFYDIEIPNIIFPAVGDRSLPLLIETLVRSHLLKLAGRSPSDLFHERLSEMMRAKDDKKET